MRRFLPCFAACLALAAQAPKVKAWVGFRPAAWERKDPAYLQTEGPRLQLQLKKDGTAANRTPGAVVEVWGDASWARQDEFKAFVRTNLPQFRTAFDAGLSASVGGAMLADLMNHPEDLHRSPLVLSPVWFNATDPWARDRRFFR